MEGKRYGGKVFGTKEAYHQYGGGYSVCMCHTISAEEAHRQYGGGCAVRWMVAVRTCHIISTVKGVQYGLVTLSVWTRVCITVLLKLLRG